MRKLLVAALLWLGMSAAHAGVSCSVPFNLTNGTTADASQVMANYNAILACLTNSTAESGANASITSLTGLTTPLSPSQGGSRYFVSGASSSGTNTIVVGSVTPNSFSLTAGNIIAFIAGASNTGAATLNVSATGATAVVRDTSSGPVALTGGEIVTNDLILATFAGGSFHLTNLAAQTGITAVTGASATYTSAQLSRTVSRSNTGAVMTDTLPGTGPGVLAAGGIINVYNNDASALLTISAGSGAVINNLANITPFSFMLLGPGQGASFQSDGSNYSAISFPARARLGANTTVFVATTGSDSNNGLVVGSPYLTRQFAYNSLQRVLDLNGFTLTFQLANGTYTDAMTVVGPFVGMTGAASVNFLGSAGTPANVFVNTGAATVPFWAQEGAKFKINGIKVQATTNLILSDGTGTELQLMNVEVSTAGTSSPVAATNGGEIQFVGNLIYDAVTNVSCWDSLKGGLIVVPGVTITVTFNATPTFTTACATSESGYMWINGTMNFSGTFTGPRYSITLNGVVNTGTANVNFFPGSAPGVTSLGGVYN